MKGMPKSGYHPAKFLLSRPNDTCIATFAECHTLVARRLSARSLAKSYKGAIQVLPGTRGGYESSGDHKQLLFLRPPSLWQRAGRCARPRLSVQSLPTVPTRIITGQRRQSAEAKWPDHPLQLYPRPMVARPIQNREIGRAIHPVVAMMTVGIAPVTAWDLG